VLKSSKTTQLCLLFGVSLLSFTGFLDATIVSTALPDIQRSLNMSVTQLQWIMNAFFLGVSAFMASTGRVGDIYGRRKVFYIGTLIFGLASIGAGLAPSAGVLILCRALQGITTAITIPVGVTLIQVAHSKKELAKAMSIFGSITGAGLAIGPVLGGALVTHFGWPAVFLVNIPFIVIGFVLCMISVEESQSDAVMSLDYLGIIFLALTITAFVFAMVEANQLGWHAPLIIISFAVSIVSLIIFIFVERSAKHPIMAGYLFRNRVFLPAMFFSFLGGSAMSVVLFIDPLYLHSILQQSNFMTGLILFIIALVVVISAYMVGHLHPHLGSRTLMIIGSFAYLSMALLHMIFTIHLSYMLIVPTFILMGIGWGIVNTVPGTALGENISEDHIGVAIGALFSFYNIGAAVILALSVVMFHSKALYSSVVQFATRHLPLSSMDANAIKQFISQPDKMNSIAHKLDSNTLTAIDILKHAFVNAMHQMYIPVVIVSLIALFGLVFIMRTEPHALSASES